MPIARIHHRNLTRTHLSHFGRSTRSRSDCLCAPSGRTSRHRVAAGPARLHATGCTEWFGLRESQERAAARPARGAVRLVGPPPITKSCWRRVTRASWCRRSFRSSADHQACSAPARWPASRPASVWRLPHQPILIAWRLRCIHRRDANHVVKRFVDAALTITKRVPT